MYLHISKLSERIGINRHTLLAYLHYLHEAKLILCLYRDARCHHKRLRAAKALWIGAK